MNQETTARQRWRRRYRLYRIAKRAHMDMLRYGASMVWVEKQPNTKNLLKTQGPHIPR